jgi:hypothetical protein
LGKNGKEEMVLGVHEDVMGKYSHSFIAQLRGTFTRRTSVFLSTDFLQRRVNVQAQIFLTQNTRNVDMFNPKPILLSTSIPFTDLPQSCFGQESIQNESVELEKVIRFIEKTMIVHQMLCPPETAKLMLVFEGQMQQDYLAFLAGKMALSQR